MTNKGSTGPKSERRGGRRQRSFAKKDGLGDIDQGAITDLLGQLAPTATGQQLEFALAIVVRGVELFRKNAASGRALSKPIQTSRRAVKKFEKGKAGAGIKPFNSFAQLPDGRWIGATDTGLHLLGGDTEDGSARPDAYEGLQGAIAGPLRALSIVHQHGAGFQHIDPNIPFNPPSSARENGEKRTVADVLLDEFANPPDQGAELAGYVYLAIARGLSIPPITSWYVATPKTMRKGWNVGRLLEIAATHAGMTLPSSRDGMEGLMARGMACAEDMLAPAGTFADGRTISIFEMEFPGR